MEKQLKDENAIKTIDVSYITSNMIVESDSNKKRRIQ